MEKSVADKYAPLIARKAAEPIAYISEPLTQLNGHSGIINAQQFLAHVLQLAAMLPQHQYAINLCDNRYLFMVALCATIVRQQTNLLASNKNPATQETLRTRYQDCYVIHDGIELAPKLTAFNISDINLAADTDKFDIPMIHLEHLAAISFTSGSTGNAKPNHKSWHTLSASTTINSKYMLTNATDTFYLLATVPGQHMWGLETSILLSLFSKVCVTDSKPLFPQDIKKLLSLLPTPRVLVSTPVHLRALANSSINFPAAQTVLCATAPLAVNLAQQVEQCFSATLREVYGCSEVGSMAIRNTAQNSNWRKFDGIEFSTHKEQSIIASAEHLPQDIELQDNIEIIDQHHFRLNGRTSDMVNIAGKRGSLDEINKVLQSFPELIDGIVFFPPQERAVPRLVALVVLPSHIEHKQLVDHFRRYLDNAFVPRPIIQIASLPREENGKLSQKTLLSFYQKLIAQ